MFFCNYQNPNVDKGKATIQNPDQTTNLSEKYVSNYTAEWLRMIKDRAVLKEGSVTPNLGLSVPEEHYFI